jgi:hypothetical protein
MVCKWTIFSLNQTFYGQFFGNNTRDSVWQAFCIVKRQHVLYSAPIDQPITYRTRTPFLVVRRSCACHKHPKPFNRPFFRNRGKARQGRARVWISRVYFWVWKVPLSALFRLVASQKGINLGKARTRDGQQGEDDGGDEIIFGWLRPQREQSPRFAFSFLS